jgi:hypothetical protein
MVASLDHRWWEIYIRVPESLSEVASEYLHDLGSTAVVFHEQAILTPQHTVCIETRPESTTADRSWTWIISRNGSSSSNRSALGSAS